MSDNKQAYDGKTILLVIVCGYLAYTHFFKTPDNIGPKPEPKPVTVEQIVESVHTSLPINAAAAYRNTLDALTDNTTETEFNQLLSKNQKAATDLSYKPLDEYLQQTFSAKDKSEWTPARARETYGKIAEALLKLNN